jgi:hypothetical protein
MYRQVPQFPNCYNKTLCIVSVRSQVGMSTHYSSLNFYKSKERKHEKIWNVTTKKEIEYKWNLNENGHLTILNAQKRKEIIRSTHMDYETSPLFNTKKQKVKPITKLVDTYFKSNPRWKPLAMN